MNRKRNSLLIIVTVVAVLILVVWLEGGAMWHMLLKMHGRG